MLALSTTAAIFLVLGGTAVFVAAVGLLLYSRRRPTGVPDIPPAMQPGPSDADLEKPSLERLQGWGVLLVVFFVVWLPLVWLREPAANVNDEEAQIEDAIERGRHGIELFSEENPDGVGCVQCHGPGLQGGLNLFQGNVIPVPRLTDVCGGEKTGHPAIKSLDDVRNTIMQGRPGTDMPSWSIRFAGSLNDQQIQDIIAYILSIQTVPFEDNVCVNPMAASPSPTPSPTAS